MKKAVGTFVTFVLLMMFGNKSNLSAQTVLTCPLISYTIQGKTIKEISDICFLAMHENGNMEIKILKKGEDGDMDKYSNNEIVYSYIKFGNKKEEAEYDIFTEIQINGQNMDEGKYYCKLTSYKLSECDYLMMFNVIDELDGKIITQVVLVRQYEGSKLKFSVER